MSADPKLRAGGEESALYKEARYRVSQGCDVIDTAMPAFRLADTVCGHMTTIKERQLLKEGVLKEFGLEYSEDVYHLSVFSCRSTPTEVPAYDPPSRFSGQDLPFRDHRQVRKGERLAARDLKNLALLRQCILEGLASFGYSRLRRSKVLHSNLELRAITSNTCVKAKAVLAAIARVTCNDNDGRIEYLPTPWRLYDGSDSEDNDPTDGVSRDDAKRHTMVQKPHHRPSGR